MSLEKIKEYTIEELHQQYDEGKFDIDFLIEYTAKRDRVYNLLIEEIERLDKRKDELIKYYENILDEAIKKINNMFDNGDEDKVIDDLLELDKILRGKNE